MDVIVIFLSPKGILVLGPKAKKYLRFCDCQAWQWFARVLYKNYTRPHLLWYHEENIMAGVNELVSVNTMVLTLFQK